MPPKYNKQKQFTLVQRSTYDPLKYEDEPTGVFMPSEDLNSKAVKNAKKSRAIKLSDLDSMQDEFKAAGRRENEGEAALYGITFDDSNYDYMQHMRPIGMYEDAYFVGRDGKVSESYRPPDAGDRMTLQDLLNAGRPTSGPEVSFKEHYQAQLPVQDSLAGLKPDMDPRLREVIEALEDEEYVENDDEDIFSELIKTGEMKSEAEWRETMTSEQPEDLVQREDEEDWEFAFRKFKLEEKQASGDEVDSADLGSDIGSDFGSNFNSDIEDEKRNTVGALGGATKGAAAKASEKQNKKKKKRIGAKTDLSGYSMSSSANYRNKGLTLLDDKFDKVEEEYAESESEEEQGEFDTGKERSDLDSIMDEFLDKYVVEGKHLYKVKK